MTEFASPSGLVVRPLGPADRAAWDPLWQGYLTFYRQALAPGVSDAVFARLTGHGAHLGLLAERDGVAVGLVHYLVHETTWAIAPTCYLEDLFVDETVRGGGVGRALIDAVAEEARKAGCRAVYWQTNQDNARARALYDQVATLSPFVRYDLDLTTD
jgi:GNAT superfamily N-acetyltransferase